MTSNPNPTNASINFVWLPGKTYAGVQEQIFSLIEHCLPPKTVVHTVGDAVEGALSLSLFIRQGREELKIRTPADIVMAHGIADKRYFFIRESETDLPLVNQYKYIFVPGSWHVNRLVEGRFRRNPIYQIQLRDDQIRKVGWLRLDPLIASQSSAKNEQHKKLRVLWAPTHNTVAAKGESPETAVATPSSFPHFHKHKWVMRLKYDYRISVHPRNRKSKAPTGDQLVWADAVVSDFGTMVFEAWALGKPVLFPRWCIDVKTLMKRNPLSAEAYIYRNRIGLHPESPKEMHEMLRVIARKRIQDPSHDARGNGVSKFIDHYIDPVERGFDAQRTARELISILSEMS
jgi:hypothetical protein